MQGVRPSSIYHDRHRIRITGGAAASAGAAPHLCTPMPEAVGCPVSAYPQPPTIALARNSGGGAGAPGVFLGRCTASRAHPVLAEVTCPPRRMPALPNGHAASPSDTNRTLLLVLCGPKSGEQVTTSTISSPLSSFIGRCRLVECCSDALQLARWCPPLLGFLQRQMRLAHAPLCQAGTPHRPLLFRVGRLGIQRCQSLRRLKRRRARPQRQQFPGWSDR
jgi:hypothetical protein